jgi:hypothetical protein
LQITIRSLFPFSWYRLFGMVLSQTDLPFTLLCSEWESSVVVHQIPLHHTWCVCMGRCATHQSFQFGHGNGR